MSLLVTRRIQVLFISDDKEERKAQYQKWRKWNKIVQRAANMIVNNQYAQDHVKDMFYLTDEAKKKLANVRKDENGILTMSRDNTTYQVLSKAFKGECPMGMLSGLNRVITATYKAEALDVKLGKRTLRSYRNTIPMPVRYGDMANFKKLSDGNYQFHVYGTWFKTWFGKDLSANEKIIDMAMSGQYKLCDSSISFDKKGKMFFNAVFQIEKTEVKLNPDNELFVRLSHDAPLVISFRHTEYTIGHKDEFTHRLEQIRHGRERAVISARYNKKGKGRKKRMEIVEKYEGYAKKYIRTRTHQYTAKVIDFALKLKCAKVTLVPADEAMSDTYVLHAWSYYGLQDKLKYKCNKYGIKFNGVNQEAEKEDVFVG